MKESHLTVYPIQTFLFQPQKKKYPHATFPLPFFYELHHSKIEDLIQILPVQFTVYFTLFKANLPSPKIFSDNLNNSVSHYYIGILFYCVLFSHMQPKFVDLFFLLDCKHLENRTICIIRK